MKFPTTLAQLKKLIIDIWKPSIQSKAFDFDVVHLTGNETINGVKTFISNPIIPDEAYGSSWNGLLEPPTKNAVYDKIQTLSGGGDVVGPASSVDNRVVLFDGLTGKLIKDSGLTLSGTNTGDETNATIKTKLGAASTLTDGYLTSTDWNTFNSKQNALGFTPEDVSNKSSSYTLSSTTTYANTKALVDGLATKQNSLGFTPEDVSNKSTNTSLGTSNTLYPTQNAVKVYADSILGNANALMYQGVIDCSTNPNYPASNAGELYIASVAGKIGGASGVDVETGDMIICNTDNTVSGNQATVGIYWNIIQKNIVGAVTGPSSSVNNNVVFFDGVTGKVIKDSGLTLSGNNTGDQTSIVGITGTKAQFDTACSDGNFLFVGDQPSLSNASAFVTATTTINSATYIDITGASITLAAGTWLIMGQVVGAFPNAIIQMFVAITDGSNNVISEVAQSRPASGTASLNSPMSCNLTAIVSPAISTTYKLRGARGLTTHTGSWTVYDGNGVNTTNHATNNSDKGTGIFAVRIA